MTPGIGRLAGRIDLGQDEDVRLVEGRGELVHEMGEPRVAVGLEDGDQAPRPAALGGVERRLDLGRMMAVVLDDHDVPDRGLELEAPARPVVGGQGLEDEGGRDVEVEADGHRGQGVGDHVHPRDAGA